MAGSVHFELKQLRISWLYLGVRRSYIKAAESHSAKTSNLAIMTSSEAGPNTHDLDMTFDMNL